jgi:hypothetical protein
MEDAKMSKISIPGIATTAFGRIAAARRRRQTIKVLESLPDHLRRDIGWTPDHRAMRSYLAN